MGMKTKKAIMEIRLEIPQEVKMGLIGSSQFCPAHPEDFMPYQRDTYSPMPIAALVITARKWNEINKCFKCSFKNM